MAIPLVGAGAAILVHQAAGRAFSTLLHPLDSYIASQFAPADYARSQQGWFDHRCLIPGVETIVEVKNRGMVSEERCDWALNMHGILTEGAQDQEYATRVRLWRAAAALKRTVPDVAQIMDSWRRGFMHDDVAKAMLKRAGGSVDAMIALLPYLVEHPGVGEAVDALLRGRMVNPEATEMLKRSGADPDLTDWYLRTRRNPLPIGEVIEGIRRGVIDPADMDVAVRRLGMLDPECVSLYRELTKAIPQVSDLVMMGIREAFRPELAQVYDYYSEFPELTRPWFRKLGLNYGTGIQINPQTGPREATLADLYWASHWHPMPLGQAYAAYQRFRPDAMARYQNENPNIKPFTRDDLLLHMRIADLPPGVRDWMVALGHQPLGIRAIQWGVRYLDKDADWAAERYLDQGYVLEDAVTQAKIQIAREEERQRAWITSLEQAANKKLVALTESLYRDGLIDRDQATRRLTQMGIPDLSAIQILDLQELEVKHVLIVSAVAATRRAFLSGEILAGDVPTQLGRFGVLPFRAQLYLQTWQIQFTQRRKRLETGKIAAMVVEGLMSAADAKQRLGNLGWSDPDATLLLAEAAGKIRKLQAAEAKAGESAAQRRARELERLAKQADTQARKLRSEANRVAPRSVLMRWAKEHEIGEDSFRSMMRERGYPEGDIDLYWQEVVTPKPRAPRPAPTVRPFPRPPGSKHPMEGQLGKWYLTQTINRSQYLDGLKSLGYTPEDAERIAYNDDLKHGKAGTTEEPPAPPPAT